VAVGEGRGYLHALDEATVSTLTAMSVSSTEGARSSAWRSPTSRTTDAVQLVLPFDRHGETALDG
jgi:hypothetical protein